MAITLTWHNVFTLSALMLSVLGALTVVTSVAIDWRIRSMEHQLVDRMTLYQREIDSIEKRIDRLETK